MSDEEDLMLEIASKEYSTKKTPKNFKKIEKKEDIIIPDIYIFADYTLGNDLKDIIGDIGYHGHFYYDKNPCKVILKNDIDLMIVQHNLDLGSKDFEEFLMDIESTGVPFILVSDTYDISDLVLSLAYGIVFNPLSKNEIKHSIDIILRKNYLNSLSINEVEKNLKEKNEELIIEKTESLILIFGSLFLIITSFLTLNITWLQWVVFIPSVTMLSLAFVSLKDVKEPVMYDVPPFVSLIIPAHNEEYSIEDTVRSVCNLDYKLNGENNFELIVCNDGSSDRTGEILAELKEEMPFLRIITRKPPKSGKGKGFVLNDALHVSRGEIIGVFDADTRVCPDFLEKIIPYLNDEKVMGVQSRVKMFNKDENFLARMQHVEFAVFGNTLRAKDILGFNGFLGGNGQFVKREAIEKAGKWDGFAVTEDLNLSIKIALNKFGIRYCGEVAVYQEAITSWRALFRQRVRWATGNFETLFIYTPKILKANISPLNKVGIIDHISFYAFNLFIFFGFITFIINIVAWFVFHQVTFIRMEAPLVIGIISAIAFFPSAIISLVRDDTNLIAFIKDLFGYWIYCYHLIPLFFKTMWHMFTRKERVWDKTDHGKPKEEDNNE